MARIAQAVLLLLLQLAAVLAISPASGAEQQAQCSSDLDCSLNGHCTGGACVCDKPWTGVSCGELKCPLRSAAPLNLGVSSADQGNHRGKCWSEQVQGHPCIGKEYLQQLRPAQHLEWADREG